jgi:hypothetical protein
MAIRKNGYVALLDVLGFSNRILHDGVGGVDTYIDTVVNITKDHPRLGTVLFSDTVVLFTFNDSRDSFKSIISVSSWLLHELLRAGVPVRGALSYGDFARSEHEGHGTVIAGRPIIDAHYYESQLQWIGIMLTPSLLEKRREITLNSCGLRPNRSASSAELFLEASRRLVIQPCSDIPLSDTSGVTTAFEGFAIVPLPPAADSVDSLISSLNQSRRMLKRLKQIAPEARSQAKYQRSLDWLLEIRKEVVHTYGRNSQ